VPTKRANTVPVHERKITPSIRLAAAGLFGGFSDAAHAVLQIAADINGVEFSSAALESFGLMARALINRVESAARALHQ
jgi:hypothetical protein